MRHRTRHLLATMVKHVTTVLDTNDWLDDPVTNFAGVNAYPVTVLDYEPQEAGVTPEYNTVAVSFGDEQSDEEFELGGDLYYRIPLFVDVYGLNEPIGTAIADDLKAGLVNVIVPILDFTTDAAGVAGDGVVEIEDVMVERLRSAATTLDKRSWRAVKATLLVYPNGN